MPDLEIEQREGAIHPCNGYILISPRSETQTDLIVIHDPDKPYFKCGVVIEMSGDETDEIPVDNWEWKTGDLIYFNEVTVIEDHSFVHWTDVFAFRRFSVED